MHKGTKPYNHSIQYTVPISTSKSNQQENGEFASCHHCCYHTKQAEEEIKSWQRSTKNEGRKRNPSPLYDAIKSWLKIDANKAALLKSQSNVGRYQKTEKKGWFQWKEKKRAVWTKIEPDADYHFEIRKKSMLYFQSRVSDPKRSFLELERQ